MGANHGSGGTAARVARTIWRGVLGLFRRLRGEVVEFVGGPARARVVGLFGAVLALSSADAATVGAVAPQLERALHIGNAKVGLLSSVALLIGAAFVLPVGLLVDRIRRIPLLSISIVLWSIASLASAFAGSYSSLLLSRLALGAVTATAGPAIASLTGDYFPARERGRVWSYILAGEAIGTAAGFMLSGAAASIISWRAAFVLLAIPGFFLARSLWRTVPEPQRGGQSRLEPGATDLTAATSAERMKSDQEQEPDEPERRPDDLARAAAQRHGVQPNPRLVLTEDPQALGLVRATRYILSIPTNVLLIIGSSLGYFFFAGIQMFALLFVRGHYHVDQATSQLGLALLVAGGLIGTLLSGHLTDLMLRHGLLTARIWVPACCYLGAVALLFLGVIETHFTPAVWFDVGGMALISAANPPARRGEARHHPRRTVGSSRKHPHVHPLGHPGPGAARIRRARGPDRRHRTGRDPTRHPPRPRLPQHRARAPNRLPHHALDPRRRRHPPRPRTTHLPQRRRHRSRITPSNHPTGRRAPPTSLAVIPMPHADGEAVIGVLAPPPSPERGSPRRCSEARGLRSTPLFPLLRKQDYSREHAELRCPALSGPGRA